ncbi:MAG TPA: RES family NAD+ phosphorylase [Candidatus Cybelea sp.]
MVARLRSKRAYHVIPSRYPTIGVFDDVCDPDDLDGVIELAQATNPRFLDAIGNIRLVRDKDRIAGPGSTPIMAAFTHAKPSRFCNGTFGIYYAAPEEATAIAETAYHRGRFLSDAHLPNERLDMRVYAVTASGVCDDVRPLAYADPIYDPDSYAASQPYGTRLYTEDVVDGIVFKSVRRRDGDCFGLFRPTSIKSCVVSRHLEYRFEDYRLVGVLEITQKAQKAQI